MYQYILISSQRITLSTGCPPYWRSRLTSKFLGLVGYSGCRRLVTCEDEGA